MSNQLRFISLGSGSSGNCYYFYDDTCGLMVDAGVGVRTIKKYFKDYGLSFSHISAIIVTHDHADHVKAVGSLSRDHFLPVYTTAEVHHGIYRNYCIKTKVPMANQRVIQVGEAFSIGDFSVTALPVPHDSTDSVGYVICYCDIRIALLTDVGHVTSDIEQAIRKADYLIVESNYDREMLLRGPYPERLKTRIISPTGHLSNDECGEVLARCLSPRIKRVWLCHLSQENNRPDVAVDTVTRHLTANGIVPGTHLQLQPLQRKTPTGTFVLGADSK